MRQTCAPAARAAEPSLPRGMATLKLHVKVADISDNYRVLHRGWLFKESDSTLRWKRRYFVLAQPGDAPAQSTRALLAYYDEDDAAGEPIAVAWSLGIVELANCRANRPGRWPWKLTLRPTENTKKKLK